MYYIDKMKWVCKFYDIVNLYHLVSVILNHHFKLNGIYKATDLNSTWTHKGKHHLDFIPLTMSSNSDDDNDDSISDASADEEYVPFVLPTTNPTMNDFQRVIFISFSLPA